MVKLKQEFINKNLLIRKNDKVLNILLKDRSTENNILWANKSYTHMGKGFQSKDPINKRVLQKEVKKLIKSRVEKNNIEKIIRTRKKGEVFTPLWIIKKKIDLVEENFKNLDLDTYINKKWLEITCGEAPYITTRYDVVTGEYLDIKSRVGFLDRKLSRISREVDDEINWFDKAIKAYQSSYGYEYQGDSLFIARENLITTFIENYNYKFSKNPELDKIRVIAEIISYNIFQMDGLNFKVPNTEVNKIQLSFMDILQNNSQEIGEGFDSVIYAKFRNWINYKDTKFKDLILNGSDKLNMKFDVVIGNPPYQKTISKTKSQNQANTKWVYHYFQEDAEKIANITCLIYPFGGWFDNHKALDGMGKRILTDGHTRVIKAFEGSDDKRAWYREDKLPKPIFGREVNLSAGVSIVLRDMRKKFDSYKYSNRVYSDNVRTVYYSDGVNNYPSPDFTFGNKLIGKKLVDRLQKKLFKIESNFVELNPDKVSFNKDDFKNPIILLTNDRSGSAGRATRFYCDRSTITNGIEYIDYYKVIMPSAYPKKALTTGGPNVPNIKKRLSELIEVLPPKSAIGRSRMILFSSKDKKEVDNFIKYINTDFFAFLILQEPNKTSSIGEIIPDQDFTDKSDIDWTSSIEEIDEQLYKKYKLSYEEVKFIKFKAKEME